MNLQAHLSCIKNPNRLIIDKQSLSKTLRVNKIPISDSEMMDILKYPNWRKTGVFRYELYRDGQSEMFDKLYEKMSNKYNIYKMKDKNPSYITDVSGSSLLIRKKDSIMISKRLTKTSYINRTSKNSVCIDVKTASDFFTDSKYLYGDQDYVRIHNLDSASNSLYLYWDDYMNKEFARQKRNAMIKYSNVEVNW